MGRGTRARVRETVACINNLAPYYAPTSIPAGGSNSRWVAWTALWCFLEWSKLAVAARARVRATMGAKIWGAGRARRREEDRGATLFLLADGNWRPPSLAPAEGHPEGEDDEGEEEEAQEADWEAIWRRELEQHWVDIGGGVSALPQQERPAAAGARGRGAYGDRSSGDRRAGLWVLDVSDRFDDGNGYVGASLPTRVRALGASVLSGATACL